MMNYIVWFDGLNLVRCLCVCGAEFLFAPHQTHKHQPGITYAATFTKILS